VKEGSALFWRKSRFSLLKHKDLRMKDLFPKSPSLEDILNAPLGPRLKPMLESSPQLCRALQKVGTIAQLAVLVPTGQPETWGTSRPILFINTHLFYHYAAPHIRTLHVWAILQEAHSLVQEMMKSSPDSLGGLNPAVVFCGDFNSDINDGIPGAIELLQSGEVDGNHWDWKFGMNFSWGDAGRSEDETNEVSKMVHSDVEGMSPSYPADKDEFIAGMKLDSPFLFDTSDGMAPEFTNFVRGYQGLLDYIWFEDRYFRIEKSYTSPGKSELGGYIPSERYPSDHTPIIADLFPHNSTPRNPSYSIPFGSHLEADLRHVPFAVHALKQEEVIAVPTDTIYGVAALACSERAIEKIYNIKRRDFSKPLAVCVADYEDIRKICYVQHLPDGLLRALLPGPVTIVLDRRIDAEGISSCLNPSTSALAVRIPDLSLLRAICRQVQLPIALTSANISGSQSPLRTQEMHDVAGQCALVLDSGTLGDNREGSTIVDLREKNKYSIIRKGSAFEQTISILVMHGLQ